MLHSARSTCKPLVVGIGSPHGDDQIGWQIVERIRNAPAAEQIMLRVANSPVDLLDWLGDEEQLYVCDGCRGLGAAGTITNWRWPASELTHVAWSGTHDLSLPAVLQLADQLDLLPQDVEIWAVELKQSRGGESISPEVEAAISQAVEAIRRKLFMPRCNETPGA